MPRAAKPTTATDIESQDITEDAGAFEQFEQARRASVDQAITIYRIEQGKPAYVGQVGGHDWTPESTRDRHGPGLYKFRLRNTATNAWGKQVTMTIAPLDSTPRPAAATTPTPAAPGSEMRDMLHMLMTQQTQIMTALVANIGKGGGGNGADADAIMRAIEFGSRVARSAQAMPAVGGIDPDEDDDEGDDFEDTLKGFLSNLMRPKSTPPATPTPKQPPKSPQAIPTAPASVDADDITKTIEHFIRAAVAAKSLNAEAFADSIIDAIGEDVMRALIGATPDFAAVIAQHYPDLAHASDRLSMIEAAIRDALDTTNADPATGSDASAG